MWNVETCFYQGLHHFICEDYAQSAWLDNTPVIALSDGCSSEQNTDIGSRVLTYAALAVMKEIIDTDFTHKELGDKIIKKAIGVVKEMEIESSCLHATLMLAYEKNNNVCVHMWGDGTIVHNDTPTTVVFKSNAPHYLYYELNDNLANFALANQEQIYVSETEEDIDPQNLYFEFPVEDTDTLLLFSDGVDTFSHGGWIPKEDLLPDMLAFPNRHEGFLVRRINKLMKKKKSEYDTFYHSDDFSVAAMVKYE